MTKRILCACISALMALATAAQGQEEELAWALRDHALAQGECLAQVLEYAQDLHMPMEGGEEICATPKGYVCMCRPRGFRSIHPNTLRRTWRDCPLRRSCPTRFNCP